MKVTNFYLYKGARRLEILLRNHFGKISGPIVNIGLQKSRTTSFHTFMSWIGTESVHCYPPILGKKGWTKLSDKNNTFNITNLDLSILDKSTTFSDTPFCIKEIYQEIARKFPNAKFFYTYRSKDDWVKSVQKHLSQDYYKKQIDHRIKAYEDYDPNKDIIFTRNDLGIIEFLYKKPFLRIDTDFLRDFYENHLIEAKIFSQTNRVTFLNLDQHGSARQIAHQLKVIPPVFIKFPHEKKTSHND